MRLSNEQVSRIESLIQRMLKHLENPPYGAWDLAGLVDQLVKAKIGVFARGFENPTLTSLVSWAVQPEPPLPTIRQFDALDWQAYRECAPLPKGRWTINANTGIITRWD